MSPRGFRYLLPREQTGATLTLPYEYAVTELVAHHAGVRLGVGRAVPFLETFVGDLVLEWAGETLPLSEGRILGGAGMIVWDQAWVNANAPSLNATRYRSTLPVGESVGLCLRAPGQTCPGSTAVASAPQFAADAFREVPVMGSGTETAPRPVGTRLTATDTSAGTLVYSLSGVDGGKFTIDDTGQMWTKAGETYEWSLPNAKRNRVTVTVTNSATGVSAKGDRVILSITEPLSALSALSVADTERNESASPMRFTVSLTAAAQWPVTVDWETADGTAVAGEDYTAASGTLTFARGETSKTVSVALIDDPVEDDGETLSLLLDSSRGATIADAEATGTIRNTEGLTASFGNVPESHAGSGEFTLRLAFSEALAAGGSGRKVGQALVLTGATRGAILRVDGRRDLYEFKVRPSGNGAVTVSLPATTGACDADDAICTAGGDKLSGAVSAEIAGPDTGQEPQTSLTASFEDVPASHDGSSAFTVRVAFSEAISTGFRAMRDEAFTVTGGSVTGAKRVDGASDLWDIRVEPSGSGAVTVSLPATTGACTATGAVCTSEGLKLSGAVSAEIAGPTVTPLTASFSEAPSEHDGSSAFALTLMFSEAPERLSFRTVRDSLFAVSGGRIANAARTEQGSDLGFRLTVEPSGNGAVTLSLATPLPACGQSGAVCASGGRALTGPVTATIAGPPSLSVADAEVDEGPNAALAFTVALSRAAAGPVTVDYATSDVTATAGEDYTAASGTLTFAAGETEKTVSVAVLDDAHDDDGETLTLTLSNPSGAWLSDATATGTIHNTDLMPQAWLGRFGRTVADQVLDAVEGRMTAARTPGVEASLAGQRVDFGPGARTGSGGTASQAIEAREAGATLEALADVFRGTDDAGKNGTAAFGSREVTGRALLSGSSFALTGGSAESGFGALWGRGAVTRFDGREGELTLDGEVTSALLGADFTRGRGTAGLVVAHSLGEGDYRSPAGDGEVESALTGLYPWGRYRVNERLTVWGVAGYGSGTLTLTPEGMAPIETDMALTMGAVGGRGVLVEPPAEGGLELGLKSDALVVRTTSEAVRGSAGSLSAAEADVTRLRLGLEGTWRGLGAAGGGSFEPSFELGVRHDGGDAETGFGVDVGAGLAWADPSRGIRAQVDARGLVTHDEAGFAERGIAGSLAWDPSPESALGPSLTVSQAVGASATGGMDALLGPQTARVLGAANDDGGDDLGRRAFEAKLGYGFALLGGRYTGTPRLGLGWTERARETVLGWRLAEARSAGLAFGLDVEAGRSEARTGDAAPEHRLGLGLGWRLAGAGAETLALRFEAARRVPASDDPEHRLGVTLTARW